MMKSIFIVLFLIFMILKLADVINWSWWWVCWPLYVEAAILALAIYINVKNRS